MIAQLTRKHGASVFVLNSAMGADASSYFFYNRVKGQVETRVRDMKFPSLTIVRPGLIGGDRSEFRRGEEIAKFLFRVADPLLPARLKINPARAIASAMLEAAVEARHGEHFIESDRLTENEV